MKFLKIKDVKTPTRGTSQSAGIDLYIPNDYPPTLIDSQESVFIPSGLKINVPENHVLIAMNKSGVALKKNLQVGACVNYDIVEVVDSEDKMWNGEETERGDGGFGSTGVK